MRLATIASVAVLAVSTAALSQAVRTPTEQKNAPANAAIATSDPMANDTAGNAAMSNDMPANDTGTPADAKTEPAAPRR